MSKLNLGILKMANILRWWDPFREIEKFFEEDFFAPSLVVPSIPVDIYETKDSLIIEVGLPGFKKDEVSLKIEDNKLIVEGNREEKKEEKEGNYYRREIKKGAFKRVIYLPYEIDHEKAKAEMNNGILKITFPRQTTSQSKEIKIE